MGFSLRPLKPLAPTLPLYLPGCLNFHFKLNLNVKSPCTTDPRQFRPIGLTSVVCKILETNLKEKLLSHLPQLSLLTVQNGIPPRRSTATNLLLPKKRLPGGLAKGTQLTLSTWISPKHRLLLSKLSCYEIAPLLLTGSNLDTSSKKASTSPYPKWPRLQLESLKVQC